MMYPNWPKSQSSITPESSISSTGVAYAVLRQYKIVLGFSSKKHYKCVEYFIKGTPVDYAVVVDDKGVERRITPHYFNFFHTDRMQGKDWIPVYPLVLSCPVPEGTRIFYLLDYTIHTTTEPEKLIWRGGIRDTITHYCLDYDTATEEQPDAR